MSNPSTDKSVLLTPIKIGAWGIAQPHGHGAAHALPLQRGARAQRDDGGVLFSARDGGLDHY